MHGRPREYKKKLRDPQAQEGYQKKVDAIRNGTALILQCRKIKRYDDVVLNASAKLLKVVPEIYTIWNFRREALGPVLAAGDTAARKASDTELALTQACLMENPKSYSTWHHRKWVVAHGLADLNTELALITKALNEDNRNFHAWNYRMFLVHRMSRPLNLELEYSEEKICEDFSNYSAWHYRTILLHAIHVGGGGTLPNPDTVAQGAESATAQDTHSQTGSGLRLVSSIPGLSTGSASQQKPIPVEVLDQEYDMVHQAFATDSRDQSPWMYYRWLVGNSLAHVNDTSNDTQNAQPQDAQQAAKDKLAAVLSREVSRLQEDHLSCEPDARWPLLTLTRLKEAQVRLQLCSADEADQLKQEVCTLYERLENLDPMRAGYYKDAKEGRAFIVVSALGTV